MIRGLANNIPGLKIATWNINGVRGRLPLLLKWLAKTKPDGVALKELKCPDHLFPEADLRKAGYGVVWACERACHGVALLALKADPVLIRKALPGDPDDKASRHIEAAVDGVLFACLYIPNGHPQPGPRSVCKLDWFDRLIVHARMLKKSAAPVALL